MQSPLSRIGFSVVGPAFLFWLAVAGCRERRLGRDDLAPCLEAPAAEAAPPRQPGPHRLSLEEMAVQQDPRKLAAVRFPLPPGEFGREMEVLAQVVRAKIAFPDEARYPNGKPIDESWRLFRLVAVWQHPSFREPLVSA